MSFKHSTACHQTYCTVAFINPSPSFAAVIQSCFYLMLPIRDMCSLVMVPHGSLSQEVDREAEQSNHGCLSCISCSGAEQPRPAGP